MYISLVAIKPTAHVFLVGCVTSLVVSVHRCNHVVLPLAHYWLLVPLITTQSFVLSYAGAKDSPNPRTSEIFCQDVAVYSKLCERNGSGYTCPLCACQGGGVLVISHQMRVLLRSSFGKTLSHCYTVYLGRHYNLRHRPLWRNIVLRR